MIEDQVLKTIQDRNMLSSGNLPAGRQVKIVIAFSGGIDSTALMHILNLLKGKLKIKLFAAHLNHKIRGRDAGLDAEFARKTAAKLKIPILIDDFDVPSFAKRNKLNLEDAARRIRYEFLERAAAKFGADRIALAHNADDNIETFLMRLIRGTGMKGLEGIPPVRDKIIRPLIEVYRADIEKYLKSKKISARLDRTNIDVKYLRNRVRRDLIPALSNYNPNIKEQILKTISTAQTINSFIHDQAIKELKSMLTLKTGSEIRLDIKKLNGADPTLKGEILRLAIEHVKKDLEDIYFVHIDDILSQLSKNRAEVDLPGVYVTVKNGMITISRTRPHKIETAQFLHSLQVPGEITDKDGGFVIEADVIDPIPLSRLRAKDPYRAYLDYDKIAKPLIVRNRRAGDVFSPLGLKGKKKLQDIFVDGKLDIDKRDSIPVIEDGKKIVWVVGYRMSEEAKVTSSTKKIVMLNAREIKA